MADRAAGKPQTRSPPNVELFPYISTKSPHGQSDTALSGPSWTAN